MKKSIGKNNVIEIMGTCLFAKECPDTESEAKAMIQLMNEVVHYDIGNVSPYIDLACTLEMLKCEERYINESSENNTLIQGENLIAFHFVSPGYKKNAGCVIFKKENGKTAQVFIIYRTVNSKIWCPPSYVWTINVPNGSMIGYRPFSETRKELLPDVQSQFNIDNSFIMLAMSGMYTLYETEETKAKFSPEFGIKIKGKFKIKERGPISIKLDIDLFKTLKKKVKFEDITS